MAKLSKTEKQLRKIAEDLLCLYINAEDALAQDYDYEKESPKIDKEYVRWKKRICRACGEEYIESKED